MILHFPERKLTGEVLLGGSKSISNRALMMCSLVQCDTQNLLSGLATAHDTHVMQELLAKLDAGTFDAGHAGTAFRFMAARLAITPGRHTLTGSVRMLERPIGPLVEALRQLGVAIDYLGKEGYPPLQIYGKSPSEITAREIHVPADVSSQFVSALLMIGPLLPNGLQLHVPEPRVSWTYVEMTIAMMRNWGATVTDGLEVSAGGYKPSLLRIEPDWSAAGYWCSMALLSNESDILLNGLQLEGSLQGDARLVRPFQKLGLDFSQEEVGVRISKRPDAVLPLSITVDFTLMPDVAQTLAVTCAGLGVSGVFSGLSTLAVKETDRIAALKNELRKVGVTFAKLPGFMSKKGVQYLLEGKAEWPETVSIETYTDHRMAMSFAALAFLGNPIEIQDADVVKKSYPEFWEDVRKAIGGLGDRQIRR